VERVEIGRAMPMNVKMGVGQEFGDIRGERDVFGEEVQLFGEILGRGKSVFQF
jgi:hypothetical protein